MGRYTFAAQNVHKTASLLIEAKQAKAPPPWYDIIGSQPPARRLVRMPMQRPQKAGKKSSKLFTPINISYEEDRLRWEYFNDHPWELARPRVVLEDDGKDLHKWDWSLKLDHCIAKPRLSTKNPLEEQRKRAEWDLQAVAQAARPIIGESVVQRQWWLIRHKSMPEAEAYDKARKEYYRYRHAREVEDRIAREEALATGAFFGPGPLEIGMQLEDVYYDNWKEWAVKEAQALKQLTQSAYTGIEEQEDDISKNLTSQDLEAVKSAVPGSKTGLLPKGGAPIIPAPA